jgi:hypothetical protein
MTMLLEAVAQVMRDAVRETVKRHSLWYLAQGALMVLGGILVRWSIQWCRRLPWFSCWAGS